MSTIATLIVETVVERKVKKIALRAAQRKIGINKFQSLVRRFDKRHTFMKNLNKKPAKMVVKMFKQYAKRKFLHFMVPARFINNWRKYGIQEAMKRSVLKHTPTELKIPYYFIKDVKKQYEKVALILEGKEAFWSTLNQLDQKSRAKVLNDVIKFHPQHKELKDYWDKVLNKEFMFIANSRITGNFEQLPCVYNPVEQYLYIPIRGFAGKMIKTYKFENIEWSLVYRAMKGADFGRDIYSQFRSGTADFYGKYWANLDPYYHPRKKR